MLKMFDYEKITKKIYDNCHNFNSLAKKLDMYPSTLKKFLSPNFGERDQTAMENLLIKIANILEVSYEELIS